MVSQYLPIPTVLSWVPEYFKADDRRARLKADLLAGATVASIAIPQALAYATLAGLPPVYGCVPPLLFVIIWLLCYHSIILSSCPTVKLSNCHPVKLSTVPLILS
jgi:SulP family sulfate permease